MNTGEAELAHNIFQKLSIFSTTGRLTQRLESVVFYNDFYTLAITESALEYIRRPGCMGTLSKL